MATHSSVLAWRIPGTAEPGGLLSMGSHRVGHDWSDLAAAAAAVIRLTFYFFMKEVAYKSKWAEKTEVIMWSWGQGPQQVMTLVFLWGFGKHLESRLKCRILDPDSRKSGTAFGEPKSQHFNRKPVPSEAGWRRLEKPRPCSQVSCGAVPGGMIGGCWEDWTPLPTLANH